ncbi:2,3-bisphosphoglycerate-dependent phosphoglycerate mutase [Arachidicoccus ginsenosidivorans]|uniref:2,3-bisphosphoglycerate-dependent phosphoglycerate mutase n=1 Tax=Arachidicoccus ginsenosidivorans TaxID=496057 RepID=A0A5B8VQ93_9BACT|nr:2,3-bisphosphoglycerate-dependent phosphoglycerate mutase [Arachidicoccus ginsenosidivorans]QEC73281.1 2,3-bisphosphoglycerate-dependent phosphoglycerate mutase [Arachidicoccus ginsenosidivorans]
MEHTNLILIRHGQSEYNLENRFTGWQDIDITKTGKQEARKAALEIKDQRIDIAFTSKLIRAQHTLQIIQEVCGWQDVPVVINKALNERSYGALEGKDKAEITKEFGEKQVWLWRRSFDVAPPGGESLKDTYNRVIPYFKQSILPCLLQSQEVLIVAHGNSLRALLMFLESLSPAQILQREIETCVPLFYDLSEDRLQRLK